MSRLSASRFASLAAVFLLLWLGGRYLLPLLLPFLLGTGIALMAEPLVRIAARRIPRSLAAGLGVTATLVLLTGLLVLLGSLAVRELGVLAGILPDMESTLRQGMTTLEDLLLGFAMGTPEGIRPLLTKTVLGLFHSSGSLLDRVLGRLPAMVSGILSHVPDGFLTLGTGLLSAFLISARLPQIRVWLREHTPNFIRRRIIPALKGLKGALWGWCKAQFKLSGMTFLIVTLGLILLRIPYAPVWAFAIALVDAVPILGTGVILLPWSLVSFVQGNPFLALGLVGLYAGAALTRSMLEPKLLGRQLGLDPLMTLFSLYAGYQLWGLPGLLLSPMIAVAALQLAGAAAKPEEDGKGK